MNPLMGISVSILGRGTMIMECFRLARGRELNCDPIFLN